MIDEISLLRDVGSLEALDEERLKAIRAPLEAAIAEENSSSARRRRVRRGLWIASAAAAACAVALPATILGRAPRPTGAQTGNTVLTHLAEIARSQAPTVPPGPGQYQYTASVEANQSCTYGPISNYCALVPERREIWIGANGSGRLRETFGPPVFLTARDRAAWVAAGSPSFGDSTSDTSFAPHTLTLGPSNLAEAPTNPTALRAAIESRSLEGGPPGAAEDFVQIGDLLRETDASPALRSALFEVASRLPNIVVLGAVTDHDGRPGVGLAMDVNGVRNELIFNEETSALIGEESVALVDSPAGYQGVKAGTLLDWTVYEASGIVDSTDATPDGTAPAPPPVTCHRADPPAGGRASSAPRATGVTARCAGV